MAKLVELTEEELVENNDLTSWSASWIGTDSSCVLSCKVPTGSLPTEVDTEGAACSESVKSTSSWVHAISGRMVVLDEELELVHGVQRPGAGDRSESAMFGQSGKITLGN